MLSSYSFIQKPEVSAPSSGDLDLWKASLVFGVSCLVLGTQHRVLRFTLQRLRMTDNFRINNLT